MAASSASNRPTPERIFATLNAHQQTAALKAAVDLDLFTVIDEGYNRTEQIAKKVNASVTLARAGSPKELHVKLRLPEQYKLGAVTVNGRPGQLGGPHGDTVLITTGSETKFEVSGTFA